MPEVALGEKEVMILQLIADGNTNKEISRLMFVSCRSIEDIRQRLKKRLDVSTTGHLVAYGFRNNLIQ